MSKRYERNKRWRYKHPETRYSGKSRYYRKYQNAENSGNRWTEEEIKLVLKHEIPDTELSKVIGRSLSAIQMCRCRFKNRKDNNDSR